MYIFNYLSLFIYMHLLIAYYFPRNMQGFLKKHTFSAHKLAQGLNEIIYNYLYLPRKLFSAIHLKSLGVVTSKCCLQRNLIKQSMS